MDRSEILRELGFEKRNSLWDIRLDYGFSVSFGFRVRDYGFGGRNLRKG